MWEQLNRIIKPNGAIVLFGSEPFSSALRMSNIKNYKYDWVYQKKVPSNFAIAKYQPMKYHENVLVFSKEKHNYYPIKEEREGGGKQRQKYKYNNGKIGDFIGMKNKTVLHTEELRYPSSVQKFNNKAKGDLGKHPTQKPLALMEYLIKTYTNENETVLDFTMGSQVQLW
jgi:site-specific DNA-methyltransferase (adenine-specific)